MVLAATRASAQCIMQTQSSLPGVLQRGGHGVQQCAEVAAEERATTFRWHRLELWLQLRNGALDENSIGTGLMRCFRALSTWKELDGAHGFRVSSWVSQGASCATSHAQLSPGGLLHDGRALRTVPWLDGI